MANSSVLRIVTVLVAAALSASVTGSAQARSEAMTNATIPQGLDRTVYHPNCPRLEYDQRCLFDGCAAECGGR